MPRTVESLTLADARRMIAAAEAAAKAIGIPYNVAVVDAGGHLVAFSRQDGAVIGSIGLAIDKAYTARLFDTSTSELAKLAQPSTPLYGVQHSNHGRVVIFGGGVPVLQHGQVIGAVGTSAGTVEQDVTVATAALRAFEPTASSTE